MAHDHHIPRSRLAFPLLFLLLLTLVLLGPCLAFADEAGPPGTVQGEGMHFAVAGSAYRDVTVDTDVDVRAFVESFPEMVTLHLDPLVLTNSAEVTVRWLSASTTYYAYVDDYSAPITLTTDAEGTASFRLDALGPHVVFIQPRPSTIHLTSGGWSDPSAGAWDPVTKTATLAKDATQTISIDADGITLDGAGHTVVAGTSANGIYAGGRTNVTIRNVTVSGSQRGVYLYGCTSCTVSGVTASGNSNTGVTLERTTSSVVQDVIAGGDYNGVLLFATSGNTLRRVTADGDSYTGLTTNGSVGDSISDSTMGSNPLAGIMLSGFSAGRVERNVLQDNGMWDLYVQSPDPGHINVIAGNTGSGGLPIAYCTGVTSLHDAGPFAELVLVNADFSSIDGVVIRGSTVKRNDGVHVYDTQHATLSRVDASGTYDGVYLDNSSDDAVTSGTFANQTHYGVELWKASRNTVSNSAFTGGAGGVIMRMSSSGNVVDGDTFDGGGTAVGSWANTSGNTWTHNTFTGCRLAMQIGDANGLVADNVVSGGAGCELLDATGTTFRDNDVSGTYVGIDVSHTNGNVVCQNSIHDNTFGLELYYTDANLVYNNDFVRNTHPSYLLGAGPADRLNLDRPIGGNYWDVWSTPDADRDGFVDVPYVLGTGVTDFLPLAAPWHSPKDATPPTTTLSLSPAQPDGEAGWYRTPPVVSLSATDAGSGVARTEFSLDGATWVAYVGPFTITAEGRTTLLYRSADTAGNVEDTRTAEVRVDTTPPSASSALAPASPDGLGGWYVHAPTVSLAAIDGGSGVAAIEYSFDGANWMPYLAPFVPSAEGPLVLRYRAVDIAGNTGEAGTLAFALDTQGPSVTVTPSQVTVDEGETASATIQAADLFGSVRIEASRGVVVPDPVPGSWRWELVAVDGPADSGPVTIRAFDAAGNESDASIGLTVRNVAPTVAIDHTVIDPMLVGSTVALTGTFTDPGTLDSHTAVWSWGDGTTSAGTVDEAARKVAGSHTYASAGVYNVQLTVTDKDGGVGTDSYDYYLVVYDPDAGSVTGGGWIQSPAGALTANPALTGKATFGFVSKYQKGANVPTGQTEFQFKLGSLDFHSAAYDWLVVSGARAQYKGVGAVNGVGSYGFMLTAIDGSPDRFRIKIWDRATGATVYDNQLGTADTADPTTAISGGSIIVHHN